MRKTIKALRTFTPVTSKTIGQATDKAIHEAFIGKISIPLQEVIGLTFAQLNGMGFLENNIKNFSLNMDAMYAEQHPSKELSTEK